MRYLSLCLVLLVTTFVLIFFANDGIAVWRLASSGVTVEGKVVRVNPSPENSRSYSEFSYSWHGENHVGRIGGAKGYVVGQVLRVTISQSDAKQYVVGNGSQAFQNIVLWGAIQSAFFSSVVVLLWWLRQYVPILRR
jgi:hypothetical protein